MDSALRNKTIFITGGSGFIASHLIGRYIEDNKIIVYDNYTRDSIQFNKETLGHENLTAVRGDVLDPDHLIEASRGADIIVHCAAIAGIFSVGNSPSTTMKVNLIGTYNVLEAALKNGIKRIIDFSTSEIYGSFVYRGKETDNAIIGPVGERRWIYAVGKLASEHMVHAYAEEYGLEVTSVRPFNVYGPRQIGEGAIQQMVTRALRDEEITVYNDGLQIRAWCYVSDFVDALCLAIEQDKGVNQIFNIGNPLTATTVYSLAQKVVEMVGSKSKIVFKKHPGEEIEVRIPNVEKAKELLGFEPKVGLEEGLRKTIQWYKEYLGV